MKENVKWVSTTALGFVGGLVVQALVDTSHPVSIGVSPQCEWATAEIDQMNRQHEEHRSTGKNSTTGKERLMKHAEK